MTLSEKDICEWMWKKVMEGKARRNRGAFALFAPYAANTVAAFLESMGWCQEDLRQALMRSNPSYCREQAAFEDAGVFGKIEGPHGQNPET